jgi:drug/metabolite transporter (DMT)-like permease
MTLLAAQLGVASVILLPLSLLIDQPYSLSFPSFEPIIGAIGLGVLCTAVAYLLYYRAIQLAGPTYASLSLLLLPIFAIILGAVILHEQITWSLYVGTPLILSGVLATNPIFNKKT